LGGNKQAREDENSRRIWDLVPFRRFSRFRLVLAAKWNRLILAEETCWEWVKGIFEAELLQYAIKVFMR